MARGGGGRRGVPKSALAEGGAGAAAADDTAADDDDEEEGVPLRTMKAGVASSLKSMFASPSAPSPLHVEVGSGAGVAPPCAAAPTAAAVVVVGVGVTSRTGRPSTAVSMLYPYVQCSRRRVLPVTPVSAKGVGACASAARPPVSSPMSRGRKLKLGCAGPGAPKARFRRIRCCCCCWCAAEAVGGG